jgi:hypothetical protein
MLTGSGRTAARSQEKLVHGMEHMLSAEISHAQLYRPVRASQLQLADVYAVRLSLLRIRWLALKPLDERSLPSAAASDYDQLHFSQREPLRPAGCKVVIKDFARGLLIFFDDQ